MRLGSVIFISLYIFYRRSRIIVLKKKRGLCSQTNATRKRQLKQKSWDHYQKAIELYKLLNWPRTHMCIAITWMKGLLQESERSRGKNLFLLQANSIFRRCMAYFFLNDAINF